MSNEVSFEPKDDKKSGFMSEVFEWSEAIIISLVCVVLLFSFVFRPVGVDGDSMYSTLHDHDRVIITNLFYKPQVGDVVVITQPTEVHNPIVKRIIATENQTVDIDFKTGEVFVDGEKLNEPYTNTPTNVRYDVKFPVTVPKGCLFVMGDNRNESIDSRSSDIGMIDERYVLGKAVFRIFPMDRFGAVK